MQEEAEKIIIGAIDQGEEDDIIDIDKEMVNLFSHII